MVACTREYTFMNPGYLYLWNMSASESDSSRVCSSFPAHARSQNVLLRQRNEIHLLEDEGEFDLGHSLEEGEAYKPRKGYIARAKASHGVDEKRRERTPAAENVPFILNVTRDILQCEALRRSLTPRFLPTRNTS